MKKANYLLAGIFALLALFGCKEESISPNYVYSIPEQTSDGWETDIPENLAMDVTPLIEMMNYINSTNDHNIHNILILKDGKLVFEEYFDGYLYSNDPPGSNGDYITYNREVDHYLASVTKSVTSVLVGIAEYEGFINSVDDKLIDYFPEYSDILVGEKADLTIHDLITMTSGLAFDESTYPYGDSRNDITQLFVSDDPTAYVLSRDLTSGPGTSFFYNSGTTNVLGRIVEKASGMSLIDFGNQYLFDPLNCQGGLWESFSSGLLFASGGLYLRPRELMKIGYLFLNNGMWGTQQFLSEDWINESKYPYISTATSFYPGYYGYQWWIRDFHAEGNTYSCFYAAGWGEQYMFIFPEQDLIIEFNCGNYYNSARISPFDLVEDYILEAIKK
ncbi:MAG: beta-lactamase family protein [Bacteroidales bacterium]|nr:beta-lactamase family protein [Bacteroidales bacterium]